MALNTMATWSLTVCFYMKVKNASVLFNPSKPPFYTSPLHVITEVVQPLCCHGIYTDRQSTTDALGVKKRICTHKNSRNNPIEVSP